MIEITPSLSIDESELQYDFVRASGPGGQNVNKVATAVQLRFDVSNSSSLPEEVKERLSQLAGSRINSDGILIIDAHQYRTQDQNRADALIRLVDLLQEAAKKPKRRKKTRPSAAAKARRLENKRQLSQKKRMRRYIPGETE